MLDALLADARVKPHGASGSSAGAMNAVMLAQGWMDGGREGARACLRRFWQAVGAALPAEWPLTAGSGLDARPNPMLGWMLQWMRLFAPGDWNPLGLNPLRDIVLELVDFERLRRERPLQLFIATTEVASGQLRVFREHELSADVLLASACLPSLHHAVAIDGRDHWDGGFAANPPVWPALQAGGARDLLLVLLDPLRRGETPRQAAAIQSRMQALAFQSAFLREMGLLAQWREQAASRWWPVWGVARTLARTRFHLIEPPRALTDLAPETRLVVQPDFLEALFTLGHQTAGHWLEQHAAAIGHQPTLDLSGSFLLR